MAPLWAHAQDVTEAWPHRAERLTAHNRVQGAEAADPLTAPMIVCHDTACAQISDVRLGEEEARIIRAGFGGSADSPATERAMIAHAIGQFESFVGAQNGTWRDHARNLHESEDEEGQMDCVSESINTRTYLMRLVQAGLLTRHDIGGFAMRYLVLLQHVAVEMIERDSGDSHVVDSWNGENGEDAQIQPYMSWRMEFLA
ncbi:MAG: hypothetical protein H7Z12_03020 [Rhodospirillaceae bacterium]|nr:hypothetical protein [Rhodospirillales bacterium]